MSEIENKESCGARCKNNWALALSIVSLALNVILITALVVCAHCHKKRMREFRAHQGWGGAPGMQCPAGKPGGFQHWGAPGFGPRGFGNSGNHHGWQGADRGDRIGHLTKALDLDAVQQAKVKQIIDEQKTQFAKLDRSQPADFKKLMEDSKAKIRAILKPDQQKKFDEMAAKFGPQRKIAQP